MGLLENARRGQRRQVPGRWVMVPKDLSSAPQRRRARVVRRRRQAFVRLLAAAGATLVLGLIPQLRVLLVAHLALDAAIALYAFQLRRWHLAELERARKVRALATDEPAREAASG